MSRPPRERLTGIVHAVARVKRAERQLVLAEETGDEPGTQVAYDAVLYNLVVIGDVVDMRDFLSHEYFRVSAAVVRRTIDEPLEQLREACIRLLSQAADGAV